VRQTNMWHKRSKIIVTCPECSYRIRVPQEHERIKPLVEALEKVDYFGDALIARNYEPWSPTVKELVTGVRVALAKVKD